MIILTYWNLWKQNQIKFQIKHEKDDVSGFATDNTSVWTMFIHSL